MYANYQYWDSHLQAHHDSPCVCLWIAVLLERSQVAYVTEVSCVTSGLQHLLGRKMELEGRPRLLGPDSFIVQIIHSKRQARELEQQGET